MLIWYIFGIGLLVVKENRALVCYSCSRVSDPSTCQSTANCLPGESCVVSQDGGNYRLGCESKQVCGGMTTAVIGRRQSDCQECCSTDRCNSINLCQSGSRAVCEDDPTFDCNRANTLFHVCQDSLQARTVCRKFCNLCNVVDGNWAAWGSWSPCNATCGRGYQSRDRTCTDPAPSHGGVPCSGSSSGYQTCTSDLCPVNGGWSTWSGWGTCSVSCDIGLSARFRSCTNPPPSKFGDHCFGDAHQDQICVQSACSDGGWSAWGTWSSCEGDSTSRHRYRTCDNPAPSILGKQCLGNNEESETCGAGGGGGGGNVVAFNAYHVAGVDGDHVIAFDNDTLNAGSAYDNSTGIFTAPVDGLYSFSAQLCALKEQDLIFNIMKEDSETQAKSIIGGSWSYDKDFHTCSSANGVDQFKAGDKAFVELTFGSHEYTVDGFHAWNAFTGMLVQQQ